MISMTIVKMSHIRSFIFLSSIPCLSYFTTLGNMSPIDQKLKPPVTMSTHFCISVNTLAVPVKTVVTLLLLVRVLGTGTCQ